MRANDAGEPSLRTMRIFSSALPTVWPRVAIR
jgi:hypothetical protein